MFSVPTVRGVVSIVTMRLALMLLVSPTTAPGEFPGTAAGFQLELVLQLPSASTFQFPLWAKANPGDRARIPAASAAPIPALRTSDLALNGICMVASMVVRMKGSASAIRALRPWLDGFHPQNKNGEGANRVPKPVRRCCDQDSAIKPLLRFSNSKADFTKNRLFHAARE